jgi:hypothetical protein
MTFHLPRVTKDTGPPADPALVVGSGRPAEMGLKPTTGDPVYAALITERALC